jgi:hypothetical protein
MFPQYQVSKAELLIDIGYVFGAAAAFQQLSGSLYGACRFAVDVGLHLCHQREPVLREYDVHGIEPTLN